jgi:hypothetical protein
VQKNTVFAFAIAKSLLFVDAIILPKVFSLVKAEITFDFL